MSVDTGIITTYRPAIVTHTPNASTKIEIYESDEWYTVYMNGSYCIGFEKSSEQDADAFRAVNLFVGGMVKCAEMVERAAADAKAKRAYERRSARIAKKAAQRDAAKKFFGGSEKPFGR